MFLKQSHLSNNKISMEAKDVLPEKWRQDPSYPVKVIYDDGDYSLNWGKFDGEKALGARWNGSVNSGFPSQGSHPTWYVEPDFIAIAILNHLHVIALNTQDNEYLDNIRFAINEISSKLG